MFGTTDKKLNLSVSRSLIHVEKLERQFPVSARQEFSQKEKGVDCSLNIVTSPVQCSIKCILISQAIFNSKISPPGNHPHVVRDIHPVYLARYSPTHISYNLWTTLLCGKNRAVVAEKGSSFCIVGKKPATTVSTPPTLWRARPAMLNRLRELDKRQGKKQRYAKHVPR